MKKPEPYSTALRNRAKRKSKDAWFCLLGFIISLSLAHLLFISKNGMWFIAAYFTMLTFIGSLLNFSKALTLHADADDALSIETELENKL